MIEYLTEILKNELFITWSDEDMETRLTRIVANAIPTMNYKLGGSNIDYTMEGMEQNLFINYCVYLYNGCASDFDVNYFNEIMQLRQYYEVMDNEED